MLACLFGPTAVFTLVGSKAIDVLNKRPSAGGKVMIALLVKLIITTAVIMGVQVGLLKAFAK